MGHFREERGHFLEEMGHFREERTLPRIRPQRAVGYSLVVKRQLCKLKILGSNPSVGFGIYFGIISGTPLFKGPLGP
jgi:hypothetical protein